MASLVSSSLLSSVRLCLYLSSRTSRTLSANGRLSQRSSCAGVGAALCRQTNSTRWNGTRGFSSRGGGSADDQQALEDIAKSIRERQYRRVVVMAGAGISTPSGIPDFRSPGSGLYDNLQQYDLPYAEAIFELSFFHQNPNPFFALAKELYPGNYRPNLTHYFVRLLHKKSQLLRMYTQNIDGLERLAGIPPEMLVEAHGTFATATCTVCLREYEGEELRSDVMSGTVPQCPTCKGVVKPDIVFFGEELPLHFFKYLTDFPQADLLIIMGTSLEVEPFASLAGSVRSSVPRLLINRDLVGPFAWRRRPHDVVQLGDVVAGVRALVDALGWTQELDALMAAGAEKAATKTEE
ncbi:NAD-dependent protein deacetylase sirtuin-3, mitochondrial [Anarrhichthys ocellatus]|uniref:NAD-dependent protein deacetylase sirtuin-3, mitochondrial n=1 Tax=Anarrhichthys ocellatus TaxID=433405 RepID=UPI0012ED56EF|nr:NAD-dependent protein deacetylase sirtuin-3, mitochondrial [Anarrhichthys ocellatus]